MSGIQRFDQSTFMAFRVQQAEELGPPQIPDRIVLPGAKASIAHDELERLRAGGLTHHQIVEHVNAEWLKQNAHRVTETEQWVTSTYLPGLDKLRRLKEKAQAEELRRRALLEEMIDRESAGK